MEINNRFKKDWAIMEDDARLPEMVEKWSHTLKRNGSRQCSGC